jgi:two-component system sensor histidine kinase PilS (NtrC family)
MEEQIRRSDRLAALGTLAASLAHELRNPLASMSGAVELLSNSAKLPDTDRRLLQIVQREAERLEKLLRDFLNFARPGEPRLKRLRLDRAAEEVVSLAGPHGAGKGVRIELETDGECWVHGDEDQLRQVLWNLLGNGLDAVPAGGRVALHIRRGEGRVSATIEDDGPGISPEDLSRIFDPFFTTKDGGTGLGLAIVHRILEAHGSAIAAESSPGHGARFSFSLPLAPGPTPGA